MLLAFLFLIIILIGLYFYYNLNNKIYTQRKQILMLKYENNNLKHKSYIAQNLKPTVIEYIPPKYDSGIVIKHCNVYLSPIRNSNIVNSLKENTPVIIQDSAIVDNITWLQICFDNESNINNKGWLIENNVKADQV